MYRIIDNRATGKTSRLMLLAKENGAAIACANPRAMQEKAYRYGITGIDFISYIELINGDVPHQQVLIDEMENFLEYILPVNNPLLGYTLSIEDDKNVRI